MNAAPSRSIRRQIREGLQRGRRARALVVASNGAASTVDAGVRVYPVLVTKRDFVSYRWVRTAGAVTSLVWLIFIGLPVLALTVVGLLGVLLFAAPWWRRSAAAPPASRE